MDLEHQDTGGALVTRDVRYGGSLPGHQELAEHITRQGGGFDPSTYPPEIQAGLRQAQTRGMARSPQEAALFACAFAEGARALMARERSAYAGATVISNREEAAERRRAEAERRTAGAAQWARQEAERKVTAYRVALESVRSAPFVPEWGRDEVARIMAERGLSADEAFNAWTAEGPESPRVGSRLGGTSR